MHEDRQKRAKGPENVLGKAKNWIFSYLGSTSPSKSSRNEGNRREKSEMGLEKHKKKQIDSHGKPLNALRGQNRT